MRTTRLRRIELAAVGHTRKAAPPRRHPSKVVNHLRGPEALLILVAGGTGLYSTVMPSWGAGPHGNGHVTVEIDLDQACEVPLLGSVT